MNSTEPLLLEATNLAPSCPSKALSLPALDVQVRINTISCLVTSDPVIGTRYLRSLGGLDHPSSGQVQLLGIDPAQVPSGDEWLVTRRHVGFVPKVGPLLSVLSGLRNVMLPALYHKLGGPETVEQMARAIIAALKCEADLHALPAYLSEEQRRQLGIARALILDPQLLFLDRPTDGLELAARDRMVDYLSKWPWFASRALVIATDDLPFVHEHANQVIFAAAGGAGVYDSWEAFTQAPLPAVQQYLEERRKMLAVLG